MAVCSSSADSYGPENRISFTTSDITLYLLSYSEYYEWLDRATKARDDFLAEKLSEEEALKIINVP